MACITVETNRGEIKVFPRWQGKNLAVHSTVIEDRNDGVPFGQATKNDEVYWHWTITHKPTGFIAARFTKSDLKVAMLIAKQFDTLFNHKDQEAVTADTEFVNEWKSVVAKYFGKVG
jgi:hypothetical protein